MSDLVMQTVQLLETLPPSDQKFAYEFVKKLVLAWDPDYTKVTDEEKKQIERAENSGFIDESEIDWDNVGK